MNKELTNQEQPRIKDLIPLSHKVQWKEFMCFLRNDWNKLSIPQFLNAPEEMQIFVYVEFFNLHNVIIEVEQTIQDEFCYWISTSTEKVDKHQIKFCTPQEAYIDAILVAFEVQRIYQEKRMEEIVKNRRNSY